MKLNVFTSTTKDGIMSKDKRYFSSLTKNEIELLYKTTISRFLNKSNLTYESAVFLNDNNTKITSRVVTKEKKKYKDKILLLKSTNPNIPVLIETSDDPVIVATASLKDIKVSAIALGTIENINNNILHEMVESLIKETNAAPFEMTFYITACPNKENYILKDINQLTNKAIWDKSYDKKKKQYYLDIRYAIFNTLIKEIVDPNYIYFDTKDTVTNPNLYSDYSNVGKNLVCVVYTNEEV